jgi:hypothetical protein
MGSNLSNKKIKRINRNAGIKPGPDESKMPLIREFMKEAGARGNPNKWAILSARVPPTLISRGERHTIEGADWSEVRVPQLVHKRELKKYMSQEQAKRFWRNGAVTQN